MQSAQHGGPLLSLTIDGKPKGGCSMDRLIEREVGSLYDRGLVGVAANVAHCPSSMAVCPPPLLRLISTGHARVTSPYKINLSLDMHGSNP